MEYAQVPAKWRKYMILVQFGLARLEDLRQDIRRYSFEQSKRMQDELVEEWEQMERLGHRYYYVVKLVSLDSPGQLPNYNVMQHSDLDGLPAFLAAHQSDQYKEVWYCRNRVDDNILNAAGRMLFLTGQEQIGHIIEQVWRCTPRQVERYNRDFPWPYLSASRPGWGFSFRIKDIHVPPCYPDGPEKLMADFLTVVRELERLEEQIDGFAARLERLGVSAFNIEYKMVGSHLFIIDWDTPNDRMVLSQLESGQ